jgi:unsaturated rhamnogalacturonyl hydrolase
MIRHLILVAALAAVSIAPLGCSSSGDTASSAVSKDSATTRETVAAAMRRAADWQLANPSKHPAWDWTQAPFYSGVMGTYRVSGDTKYLDAMVAMGEKNEWKPGPRKFHADDHAVILTYVELYRLKKDPKMLAPSVAVFDSILEKPAANPEVLDFTTKGVLNKWSWCDALFMGPTSWTALAEATGEKKYLEFSDREFWRSHEYLYDKGQQLFFRDSSFFKKKEANGASVFWGRGNGWVMGGLVHILKNLPKDHPSRPKYETLLREMSEKLLSLQQADGSWHASLLDPASYQPEMSSTGFIAYGIAWGVNNGVLERAKYEPGVRKAWSCITSHLGPDGRLGSVQPIGADPRRIKTTDTEVYGTGAFLLFGEQMHALLGKGE